MISIDLSVWHIILASNIRITNHPVCSKLLCLKSFNVEAREHFRKRSFEIKFSVSSCSLFSDGYPSTIRSISESGAIHYAGNLEREKYYRSDSGRKLKNRPSKQKIGSQNFYF